MTDNRNQLFASHYINVINCPLGLSLKQSTMKQYFNPLNLHGYFGEIEETRLENIFGKSKPRFFKRTSSAVWNSPPRM